MEEVGSAVIGHDDASDYDHWPDDSTQISTASTLTSYSRNGLREREYIPANEDKKIAGPPSAAQPIPYALQPPAPFSAQIAPPAAYAAPQYYGAYPAYAPHMAYPAPGFYGYPNGGMPFCPPGYTPVYYPPAPAAEKPKQEKKKSKKPEIKKWQGRTKAEVEEDNMKIAKEEGAWDARKVEPIGLAADQMVWVVELDGTHTLR